MVPLLSRTDFGGIFAVMSIMKMLFSTVAVVCLLTISAIAQKNATPAGWHLLDKATDGYQGISLEKAYQLVKDKKPATVIVGVIDGGTDTTHEDLKEVLWINNREIPGNGKDDDGNGYVDDIHGWNFLGNAAGENINKASDEKSRIYHRYKDIFKQDQLDSTSWDATKKANYKIWQQAAAEIIFTEEDAANLSFINLTFMKQKSF